MDHQEHQGHQAIAPRLDEIGREIVDSSFKVHRALGPGLLESAYEHCLVYELAQRGLSVQRQVALPVVYESVRIDAGYRLDLLVEGSVIIEVKSVDEMSRLFEAQVLTYLRLSGCRLGYLINFNVPLIRQGIRRLAQ